MDLQWSPKRSNHLIAWWQDITLYEVEDVGATVGKLRQGCELITKLSMTFNYG